MLNGVPVKFDVDIFLRDRGFEVVSRPAHGQPVWKRGSEEYIQSEALALANDEHRRQIEKLQASFSAGSR
jgi:hypothetical protein